MLMKRHSCDSFSAFRTLGEKSNRKADVYCIYLYTYRLGSESEFLLSDGIELELVGWGQTHDDWTIGRCERHTRHSTYKLGVYLGTSLKSILTHVGLSYIPYLTFPKVTSLSLPYVYVLE